MKKVQTSIAVRLNRVSISASEAVHEVVYNKIYEAIYMAKEAQRYLELAVIDLKALAKSRKEGG